MTTVVTRARLASVTKPETHAAAMASRITTPMPTALPRVWGGSGLGACLPTSPRFRRKAAYWASPSAMPTAAAPKP
jgi:hypothetical protein